MKILLNLRTLVGLAGLIQARQFVILHCQRYKIVHFDNAR